MNRLARPESGEQRDLRHELHRKRHEHALVLLQVERLLSERSPGYTRVVKELLAPIVDSYQSAGLSDAAQFVETLLKRYQSQRSKVAKVLRAFEGKYQQLEPAVSLDELRGIDAYTQLANTPPGGAVSLECYEGYLVLDCQALADYDALLNAFSEPSSAMETIPQGFILRDISLEGIDGLSVTVINPKLSDVDADSTFAHERQHFINFALAELFRGFETNDGSVYRDVTLTAGEHLTMLEVKDEVLARIRDGSNAEAITDFLDYYDDVFNSMTQEYRQRLNHLMLAIQEELQQLFEQVDVSADPTFRAALVYEIIDIPLIRLPHRLAALRGFYITEHEQIFELIPNYIPTNPIDSQLAGLLQSMTDLAVNTWRLFIEGGAHSTLDAWQAHIAENMRQLAALRHEFDSHSQAQPRAA